jgi:two-component system, sensor histidine kinase and response regulator
MEQLSELESLKKKIAEIADSYFWQSEELKARNEEIEAYADVLFIQKEKLKISNRQLIESERLQKEAFQHLARQEESVRRSQKELARAQQQAESANDEKIEFITDLSHEIRTLMNSVIGFGGLLKNTPLDKQQKEYVDAVSGSGAMLISIVDNFTDLSKIGSSTVTFEEVDFDLESLIVNVLKFLGGKIAGKPPEMIAVYPGAAPTIFKGDPLRIRRIFLNLIGASIQCANEGEISVSVTRIDAGSMDEGATTELRSVIQDTGTCLPADNRDLIFNEQERQDGPGARKYGGSDLGLWIARTLVEKMGGTIRAISEPGRGSQFVFTMRLKNGSRTTDDAWTVAAREMLNGKNVVVIDDNDRARQAAHHYCEALGMVTVYSTDRASSALAWLDKTETSPDLMLIDLVMTETDGFALVKKIRRIRRMKNVVCIGLIAGPAAEDPAFSEPNGFNGFLAKPFTRKDFLKVLSGALKDDGKGQWKIPAPLADTRETMRGLSVLVVEDNPLNQKLMVLLLDRMKCVVEIANNGHEAVLKATGKKYDIILMDLQMPLMGGLEATEFLRTKMQVTTPIIALTARVSKEDDLKCIAAGMNDFLTKPVEITILKEKIIKWAGKKSDGRYPPGD